jgi:hypothetical protein
MTAENYCLKKTEGFRKLMSDRINRHADVFAIDSMPIEICKLFRERRNKMWKEAIQQTQNSRTSPSFIALLLGRSATPPIQMFSFLFFSVFVFPFSKVFFAEGRMT